MQHITLQFLSRYPFLDDIMQVFATYSDLENAVDTYPISTNAKPLIDLLDSQFCNTKKLWRFVDRPTIKQDIKADNKKAIICFSGGKDSVNVALQLKDKYDLTLYYLKGVNISYPNELEHAQECANALGLPLVVEQVKISGHTNFLENPTKNAFIFACALNYGLSKGITTYFFGNASNENISNCTKDRNFSDTKEMFEIIKDWYSKDIGINIINYPIIESIVESVINIGNSDNVRNLVQFCITPHRFQKMRHDYNEKKYNLKLPHNLCGSCWKCCMSYIVWVDLGKIEYNKEFYFHCLDILTKKSLADRGTQTNSYQETYEKLIGVELFNQSKLKGELL